MHFFKHCFLFLICLFLLPGNLDAEKKPENQKKNSKTFIFSEFNYQICLPELSNQPKKKIPLLLFFSPSGNMKDPEYLFPLCEKLGIAIAGTSSFANGVASEKFLPAIARTLNHLLKKHPFIDRKKIILSGCNFF